MASRVPPPRVIPADQARAFLVCHHGLARPAEGGVRELLDRHRCVQLDPLDRVGSAPDLLVHARLDGTRRGQVHAELGGGAAFEHFFKARCLLPPHFLPYYRDRMRRTAWHSYQKMCGTPPEALLEEVLAELRARGPRRKSELEDRGMAGKNYDHPWARKATMNMLALDALWARCSIVPVDRSSKGRVWDLTERAMPQVAAQEPEDSWERFCLRERAAAAGLLPLSAGPWWSQARELRRAVRGQPDLHEEVELLRIEGMRRLYLAPRGWDQPEPEDPDERMRALSPLDPLLWDRDLIRHLWDFDYVWEVYKPKAKRRWGYYVLPLLHRGRLVGRFEGRRGEDQRVEVQSLWREPGERFDPVAFADCIERLSAMQ